MAQVWATDLSQNLCEVNTLNTSACSAGVSAFDGLGRDGLGAGPWTSGFFAR